MEQLNITPAEMADFPFLVNSQIYNLDGSQSSSGSLDFFGQAVFRPDLMLADLVSIVTPDPTFERTFLRNIAEGETPTFVTGAECETGCGAFDMQVAIPLGVTAADAAAGMAGDGDTATLGPAGDAAGEAGAAAGDAAAEAGDAADAAGAAAGDAADAADAAAGSGAARVAAGAAAAAAALAALLA